MKSIVIEAITLAGGKRNARRGMVEGLPLFALLAGIYFLACAL